jgi:O-antigen biosynthesis protein WbqV
MKSPSAFARLSPWLVLGHDLVAAGLAMYVTLAERYEIEGKPLPFDMAVWAITVYVALCGLVFPLFRTHLGVWRHLALNDVLRLLRAAVMANLLLLPVLFVVTRLEDFPRSAPFLAVILTVLFASLARVIANGLSPQELRQLFRFEKRDRPSAVVVGATESVAEFLRALRKAGGAGYRVAGVVSTDGAPPGRIVQGAEVLSGLARLPHVVRAIAARDGRTPQIVLAEPRPSRALLDSVVSAAAESGATVSRTRRSGGGAIAPVSAADLLARPARKLDPSGPERLIAGKTVLITGAGGTIGGELTRQVARLKPARLVLVDSSELALYSIDQELKEAGAAFPWSAELADVRDLVRMTRLFEREAPQVVLHAAALKHVPLMEEHPSEAVLTNVVGMLNVFRLARESAEAFVFISTDKAVNPTNVMGATKRVAERAIQALAPGGRTAASLVRFGNVLGSNGSVVPLFERQIAEGGPLTVTHPDMVRWFMTVQEAASLVLQAAALPTGPGEAQVYVLDMGEPVKIDQLARQLIRLHGLTPDRDIQIKYTGLRPGEKLTEEIFYAAEDVRPTEVDGVLAARAGAEPWAALQTAVETLAAAAEERDDAEVLRRLKALEPAFTR